MSRRAKSPGFTLVEVAVVMTIIALLMIAIFKGQSLIGTGQSQAVLAAVKDSTKIAYLFRGNTELLYETAFTTFVLQLYF